VLNRPELLKQLQDVSDALFIDHHQEYDLAAYYWSAIAQDSTFPYKIRTVSSQWPLPFWTGKLDDYHDITRDFLASGYRVCAVDGSQIYPDKHQGTTCSLINTGLVSIEYSPTGSRVEFSSTPTVYMDEQEESTIAFSAELINCKRQEYELQGALTHCTHRRAQGKELPVLLFDGSLIFWHLESKDVALKITFLSCYMTLLEQLYQQGVLMAGYISLPKAKELVNLVRIAEQAKLVKAPEGTCDHVIDGPLLARFLQEGQRTTVFKSGSSIVDSYPDHLKPYFFYMHVGQEVARIELPAWIATDDEKTNQVAAVIYDQAIKGRGYPVVLAEAHEQAVIKGPDRDFFYQCIYKLGVDAKKKIMLSPKNLKKKGIGI